MIGAAQNVEAVENVETVETVMPNAGPARTLTA